MSTVSKSDIQSAEDVKAGIRDIADLIKANAGTSEAQRRVSQETIDALKSAGAFRIATPRRYGGLETSLRDMMDVSALIAESDGGASWVVTLSNINAWVGGLNGGQAADEVWAQGPDSIIGGVVAPSGTARAVPGGYQVSGSWAYSSASLHADWAGGGVYVLDEAGEVVDQGMVSLPRGDFRIEDTWYVAGMRSSGSNTVIAEDVFVPEHRFGSLLPVMMGSYLADHPDSAFYRSAIGPMLVMVLVGPQLGLARAALNLVTTKAPGKALAYTTFERQADSVAFQLLIAEAATKIDTAHLHAHRAAGDVQRHAEEGVFPDTAIRARIRADAAVALRNVNEALNILLDANGSGSFAEVNVLQRIWRDSNVAARHAVILPHVSMETYGKALLGVEDHITQIL
ncbi:oxidoreductase [Mycolicibacterium fluoranthenivorans]|uniref:Oxidoreductase n=1 Tax=Mycolicibacterium fluoranthenivorans TaxID=258505 RepID=A0A7G8PDT3_9MYCO|nr:MULTISPECIES: oxidoreductase [Mycobacteriaceae]MCV7254353.1 oxidoreductase [Mycobacterium hackensackense]QNJ92499.1 oxidoreductase [Mycolicibacterium fluoranthenivorans]